MSAETNNVRLTVASCCVKPTVTVVVVLELTEWEINLVNVFQYIANNCNTYYIKQEIN